MIIKSIALLITILLLFYLLFISVKAFKRENNKFKDNLSNGELQKALEDKEIKGFTQFDFNSSLLSAAVIFIIATIIFLGKMLYSVLFY